MTLWLWGRNSFIHYGDLYSAPSRLLLRSAPDPCTAKKKSFETRVECVRKNLCVAGRSAYFVTFREAASSAALPAVAEVKGMYCCGTGVGSILVQEGPN